MDMSKVITGQVDQYCLTSSGGPLTVALVWHDPPALLSAQNALVNDLDLTVRAAGLNGYPLLVRHPNITAMCKCLQVILCMPGKCTERTTPLRQQSATSSRAVTSCLNFGGAAALQASGLYAMPGTPGPELHGCRATAGPQTAVARPTA